MPHRVMVFCKSKAKTRFGRSLTRAFGNLGHEARFVNFPRLRRRRGENRAVKATLRIYESFRPDLVFVYAKDVGHDALAEMARRTRCVVFTEDLVVPMDPVLLRLARLADLLLITNRTQVADAESAGVRRAQFIRGAVDEEVYHLHSGRIASRYRSQVAFIGRPGNPDRHRLLRMLDERFELKVFGSADWPAAAGLRCWRPHVFPRQYRRICGGSDVIIGLDDRHDFKYYCSNRNWYTLGSGGFLVTSRSPGLDRVLEHGRHVVLFDDPEECCRRVAEYLGRPEERRRIAAEGHRFVREERTFEHFAQEVLAALEGETLPFND